VQNGWFLWGGKTWEREERVAIREAHFAGLGTRNPHPNGSTAIEALFRDTMVQ
jgi:hypothetical protein